MAVRLAAGLLGGLLISLGLLGTLLDSRTDRAGVTLAIAIGSLFLIPALLSGPRPSSRTDEAHERLAQRVGRISRLLMWTSYAVWACIAVSSYALKERPAWWPDASSLRIVVLATSLAWLGGFVLQFFHAYYLCQDAENASPSPLRRFP